MNTRDCDCPHSLPFCTCALGYTGAALELQSRVASSIIGWPTLDYDPDALAEHNARMDEAWVQRAAIEAANAQPQPMLARADKPRIPLGTRLGGPDCVPCKGMA